ncbi:MAG: LysR family transcriptional regulator, partial [Candidatus Sericytochromatia bacterium]
MDKLFSCKVFIEIVENNSFVKASEKLNISTAMTSKYLQFLEENLQLRLLNRTNKKISLTEEGKIYFERCKDLINDFEETELSLKGSKSNPKGVLKVALPNWFQFGYFTEGVAKYLEKYPDVIIEFSLNDMIIDLVEEGIDIALRVTS